MEKVLIVSLNFNPGHVSHLIASYLQFQEIGYACVLYINKEFIKYIPKDYNYCLYGDSAIKLNKFEHALFLFPSIKNIKEMVRLKFINKTNVIYIFHEPFETIKVYYKSGFSIIGILKLLLINFVNAITTHISSIILLPSHKALKLYQEHSYYRQYDYYYLPLMYDMENVDLENTPQYISYIGTIANDHSFNQFFYFVEYCINHNLLLKYKFLIATKNHLIVSDKIEKLINTHRLTIIEGKPLTNSEINSCYAQTAIVWNAYIRTTQSGVLAKAFMFGIPAIILKKNTSEFVVKGKNVETVEDNTNLEEILEAINKIDNSYSDYSKEAQNSFMQHFYYRTFNSEMKRILSTI